MGSESPAPPSPFPEFEKLPKNYKLPSISSSAVAPSAVAPSADTNEPQFSPLPSGYALPSSAGGSEPPSWAQDLSKSAVSGLAQGVVGLPGAIGGMGQMVDAARDYGIKFLAHGAGSLGLLPEGKTPQDLLDAIKLSREQEQSPAENKGNVNTILGVPFVTPQGMVASVEAMEPLRAHVAGEKSGVPFYHGKTSPGRIIEGISSAAPSAALMPGGIVEKALSTLIPATTSSIAQEAMHGAELPWYLPEPGTIGAIAGMGAYGLGKGIASARAPDAVSERAKGIASQVLREALPDAENAKTMLKPNPANASPSLLPGVNPTTAQLLRSGEMEDLQHRLTTMGAAESSLEPARISGQVARSHETVLNGGETLADIIGKGIPTVDMQKALGITGNAQGEAAIGAKGVVNRVEQQLASHENEAWNRLSDTGATVSKRAFLPAIYDYLQNLDPVSQRVFPSWINGAVNNIVSSPGDSIPLQSIQNLRSLVLSNARQAYNSPTPIRAADLNKFATVIADGLQEPSNFVLAGAEAPALWNQARAATKKYNELFGSGFAKDIVEEHAPGQPRIAGEATFDRMLSGSNAAENLRQMRAIPGVDFDKHASDWMIGKLTKNGDNLKISPQQIQAFITDPKNASIIHEIPGLSDRLQSIAQQAGENHASYNTRSLLEGFQRVLGQNSPKNLHNFLEKNGDAFKSTLQDPSSQNFVDSLAHSAKTISNIPREPALGTQTLDRLSQGRILDILYGRAAGVLGDGVMGDLAGHVVGIGTGYTLAAPAIGALASMAGYPNQMGLKLNSVLNSVLFGSTQAEAVQILQQAARDPQVAHTLLQRPTPESINGLTGVLKKSLQNTAEASARTALTRFSAPSPFSGPEQQSPDDRAPRKTGGKVSDSAKHDRLLGRLMALTEKAKRTEEASTKPLLNAPDEAIVHALHVANAAI